MKYLAAIGLALLVLAAAPSTYAIDKDVQMIDTIGIEMANYTEADYFGGSLWVENLLAAKPEHWALVAGIGLGEYEIDDGDDASSWFAAIGIKYYLVDLTSVNSSLALIGSYRNFENDDEFDIAAGTLVFRMRFLPQGRITPYIVASASFQACDFEAGYFSNEDENFNSLVTTVGAGVDFMANEEFAFVFDAGFSESTDLTDGVQYADGFYAGIYMKYYWE